MSWLKEMHRDAVALCDPDLVLTEHMDVCVLMDYDDGYDPTYGGYDETFEIKISVFDNATNRYLVDVSYAMREAQEFWVDLMKRAGE